MNATPVGSGPLSESVGTKLPVAVTVKVPLANTLKVAAFPLVIGHRHADGSYATPVSAIVANFTPPGSDRPSLLRHGPRGEVDTLFHEFGHILHQSLTRAEFARFNIDIQLILPGLVKSDDLDRHLIRNEGKVWLDFEGAQPSEEVADRVVKSMTNGRREKAVGTVSWWLWFGRRTWPRGVRWIMKRKVMKFRERAKVA